MGPSAVELDAHGRGERPSQAYGERQYLTLGLETGCWTRRRAEEELQNILADVRRGIWIPPDKHRSASNGHDDTADEVTPFGPFARGLVAARQGEVNENTHGYLSARHLVAGGEGLATASSQVEVEALIADYEAGGLARDYGIHRTPVSAHVAREARPRTADGGSDR